MYKQDKLMTKRNLTIVNHYLKKSKNILSSIIK